MFETPAAKRVKRIRLFNSDDEKEITMTEIDSSRDKSSNVQTGGIEDRDLILPDYGFEYDFVSPDQTSANGAERPQPTTISEASKAAEKTTEVYQFNLFAPSRPSKEADNRSQPSSSSTADKSSVQPQPQSFQISIRSPSPAPETTGPGSLTTHRPLFHYFTSALPPKATESLHASYAASAIDTSTLTKLSKLSWPGTHQSWRIITLPAHRKQIITIRTTTTKPKSSIMTSSLPTEKPRHRARPSKKRRDLARSSAQKRQMIIDETKTKEEHEREKKNKKNRERKLKRRAKERREKEAVKGSGGEVAGGAVEGSVSVSVDGSAN